jgi:hypothetical protein
MFLHSLNSQKCQNEIEQALSIKETKISVIVFFMETIALSWQYTFFFWYKTFFIACIQGQINLVLVTRALAIRRSLVFTYNPIKRAVVVGPISLRGC